ncbi:MAG TPA: SEC-C metal-binding domain-containing protein [Steroidobacteraceae bacterium]|nr:SEC-C metal-binding domain-containing protein [Steroidobacteraceae bacterium]
MQKKKSAADEEHAGHVHGPDCDHDHGHAAQVPHRREAPKLGRNDPCFCGSGRKYKKCHGAAES